MQRFAVRLVATLEALLYRRSAPGRTRGFVRNGAQALFALVVTLLTLLLWTSRDGRFSAADALHAGAAHADALVSAPRAVAAGVQSARVEALQMRPPEATTIERVATPAETSGEDQSVTICPVDRQGRSLTVNTLQAGASEQSALTLELWSLDGAQPMDEATFRGAPLVLCFRAGQERGFVTSYDRGRRCGAQDAWFPEPEQHGARRDVLGEWGGVEVVAGTKVDVVFARGGEVRGMFVCPRGLTADRLEVWVRRASSMASPAREGDENGPVVVAAVDTLGAFVVRGVDAGRCRVEFRRKGGRMPLHAIDDVDVRLDEVCADPRLVRVDLAPELDAVTLTVIDPVGAPLHGAVAVLRAGAGFEVNAYSDAWPVLAESAEAPAQLHLLLPRGLGAPELGDPLIVIGRSGFVPEVLRPPFSDQVVRLTPCLSLTVRPRQPFVAEDGDLGFWLRLHRADAPRTLEVLWSVELPEDSWGDTTPASLTPDDPLFVTAPGPGRYELDVLVRERVGSRFLTRAEDLYVGTGVFVDIAATGATVVIDIPVDLAAFRAPR